MFKGRGKEEYVMSIWGVSPAPTQIPVHGMDAEVCICFYPLTSFLLQTDFTLALTTVTSSLVVFIKLVVLP